MAYEVVGMRSEEDEAEDLPTPTARVSVGIIREWRVVRWQRRALVHHRYLEARC